MSSAVVARRVRLRRTSPDQPGWTRRRSGRGFRYLDAHGEPLGPEERQRVLDLAIPPAWARVWICEHPNGHLQAVGTDAAGRQQYLYHPQWRLDRDLAKFEASVLFGDALGRSRSRVARDLGAGPGSVEAASALAFRLLDLGCFRVGNDVYADTNGSFGLTTLERRHVRRRDGLLHFDFVGKSGVEHHIEIADPTTVEALEAMRGRRTTQPALLVYKAGGRWHALGSDRVNDYIGEVTGIEATAKNFRTWHATVVAAASLATAEPVRGKRARSQVVKQAMVAASDLLGNTPTQARTSYVDPRIVTHFEAGRTVPRSVAAGDLTDPDRRRRLEREVIRLLEG